MFITLEYSKRGDLNISIESPQGTEAVLLTKRQNDIDHKDGIQNWPFVSVHTWGENPSGMWKIKIQDNVNRFCSNESFN